MVVMNILRILTDVSFFLTFAGLFAALFGGSGAFVGVLLQCICYGFSCLGRNRRWLRMLCLLPMVLGWVITWGNLADCVMLLLTACYIIWLVFQGNYELEHDRQRRLFQVFWKVLIVFVLVAALMGGGAQVSAVSLPYALVMLVVSVLLLRALRHAPKVYCQPRYQLVNLAAVAAVVAAGWLMTRPVIVEGVVSALKTVFAHVIQPIMEFLLDVLLWVLSGVAWLFSRLFSGGGKQQVEEPPQIEMSGTQELFGTDFQTREPAWFVRVLGTILLCVVVITLLVLFFRWLGKRFGGKEYIQVEEERQTLSDERQKTKRKETTPVRSIRAQYRKFLKRCSALGIQQEKSTTSLEMHRNFSAQVESSEASFQIRELYIKARYAGKADAEGAKRMKRLCSEVDKASNEV